MSVEISKAADPYTVEQAHADGNHVTDEWFANICPACLDRYTALVDTFGADLGPLMYDAGLEIKGYSPLPLSALTGVQG